MADLLTRLAERALGVAPIVKPVIAPAFGPGLQSANGGVSEGVERQVDAQSSVVSAPPPPLATANAEQKQPDESLSVPGEMKTSFEPHRAVNPPLAATTTPHIASIPPPEVSEDRSPHAREPQASIAKPPASVVSLHPPAPVSVETHQIVEAHQIVEVSHPGDATRGVVGLVLPSDRRALPDQTERREPGSSAAPVRITIGRVEVRAVFPPAPAPARADHRNTKPALTLEEYTKQRNRRER